MLTIPELLSDHVSLDIECVDRVCVLTTYGRKVVYLMTKLQRRIFDVANAAIDTTVALPSQLARTFRQLDAELDKLVADAQLAPAKS